jgi:hypothetical protein
MSSTPNGGDKVRWIKEAWNALTWSFPRVQTVDWFLENKGNQRWDLNSGGQEQAWIKGLKDFRYATGASKDMPDFLIESQIGI